MVEEKTNIDVLDWALLGEKNGMEKFTYINEL